MHEGTPPRTLVKINITCMHGRPYGKLYKLHSLSVKFTVYIERVVFAGYLPTVAIHDPHTLYIRVANTYHKNHNANAKPDFM
jgi:hypothetical protein